MLDRDLRYVRINERLAEINGIPAEAHIGKRVHDLMPELAEALEPEMRRVLETGQPRLNIEIVGETPAQQSVKRSWLEQWLPLTDADGRVTGMSIVAEEITERKKIEEVLQKVHEDLEEQVEERTVELRTALSEIKTMKDQLEAENIYFREETELKGHFVNII
ncbi:MAG TPA: PAS domain-containing protein, partial [Desulfobacterales bacterium]|nr:PAS domain-containing protein [Desulfobacterales bacterium]